MATGAAGDGMFWSVLEGCISCYDNNVERRPYHRNCGCALHNKSLKSYSQKQMTRCNSNSLSYPMRRAWSESNLVFAANSAHASPSPPPPPPPTSAPVKGSW